jgi:hypothetical protein
MTCDPEGRQEYAHGLKVSIECGADLRCAPSGHMQIPIWRRTCRRYRLPGLPTNNYYLIVLGTQLAAGITLWNRCVRDLQAELPEQDFNTWIRPLQAVEDGAVLRLLAPGCSNTTSSASWRSLPARACKPRLSSRSVHDKWLPRRPATRDRGRWLPASRRQWR